MPDGMQIPGGPVFIGFPQPPDVPCDPTGDGWRGPPGPVGPAGIQGPPGTTTVVGGVPEAPTDGVVYGRQGSSGSWIGALPAAGGTISGPVTINGPITGTGIGWDIGDVPVVGSQGGIAAFHPPAELIFQRASFAATDNRDFHFRRAPTFTGGTQSQLNRTLMVETGVGAGDGTKNWGFLTTIQTASTTGSANTLAAYMQMWKNAGSNAQCWGAVVELTEFTGQPSSVSNPCATMELDLTTTNADDYVNGGKWGGFGARHFVHFVGTRQSGSAQNEITHCLWIGGGNNTQINSILGADLGPSFTGCQTYQVIDARGFIPPTGSSQPVASVRMSANQIVDFNGGAALNSVAGAYLQYRTATSRLYYVVAGVDQWSVDASGNVRARGTVTGSTTP